MFYNFNAELDALQRIAAELERPVSQINGHIKDLTAYETSELFEQSKKRVHRIGRRTGGQWVERKHSNGGLVID